MKVVFGDSKRVGIKKISEILDDMIGGGTVDGEPMVDYINRTRKDGKRFELKGESRRRR